MYKNFGQYCTTSWRLNPVPKGFLSCNKGCVDVFITDLTMGNQSGINVMLIRKIKDFI
jgi:riboflavin transporter FmnP